MTTITDDTSNEQKFIKEGQAVILENKNHEVFYNPVQETNRDLSIIAIKHYKKLLDAENAIKGTVTNEFTILEGLSATGLRSVRYFKEIPGITRIYANDIDASAVEAIKRNIEVNNISLESIVPNHGDATIFMLQNRSKSCQFDVVDLDPYGSPAIFLDAAVQAVKEGGLLCVTCTDMNVLCGNNVDTCHSKYGSIPLRGKHCHESALRIVLASIQAHANRYKRYIVPLLSLSIDFYVRMFVRVFTSPFEVKKSPGKIGWVYQCLGCGSYEFQAVAKVTLIENNNNKMLKVNPSVGPVVGQACEECGKQYQLTGPLWKEPICDPAFAKDIYDHLNEPSSSSLYGARDRLHALLTVYSSEVHEKPLFLSLSQMCNVLHVTPPSLKVVRSALLNGGYKVSSSHTDPLALKTDAPNSVLWDILRAWHKDHPNKKPPSPSSPAAALLAKQIKFIPNFKLRDEAVNDKKVPRFLPNPKEGWGPMARAKPSN
eukprot:TRINITY_DN1452_c0_g1_i3.p1 TRINITY_DN1452_c0_g1~~TRINITY_DN1452_c0_g1_i3.p1  ORF type:complete len:486 (-),score=74.43 TRINITY_DN1452_c0_g1_i3:267-1724(-)